LSSSPEKILYQKGGLLWQQGCHSNKRDEEGGCNEGLYSLYRVMKKVSVTDVTKNIFLLFKSVMRSYSSVQTGEIEGLNGISGLLMDRRVY
jgi:hypothetical protein